MWSRPAKRRSRGILSICTAGHMEAQNRFTARSLFITLTIKTQKCSLPENSHTFKSSELKWKNWWVSLECSGKRIAPQHKFSKRRPAHQSQEPFFLKYEIVCKVKVKQVGERHRWIILVTWNIKSSNLHVFMCITRTIKNNKQWNCHVTSLGQ